MIFNGLHEFLGQCAQSVNMSYGLYGGLFIVGLVGGFSHCTTMCGPFVIAQTGELKKMSDAVLLPYHLGRIVTYSVLAVILYFMVNLITFFSPIRVMIVAPLLFSAGVLFFVNALPGISKIFPWMQVIRMPFSLGLIEKLHGIIARKRGVFSRFVMGMVLGLMPCGMVVAALMASATATTWQGAMFAMSTFGVGTMPALILTAIGGYKLKKKYPEKMKFIRSGLMIWSGLWLFLIAGMMLIEG